MRKLESRLAKLESGSRPDRDGPEWWAVQKWLGHKLTPEQYSTMSAFG